MSAPDSIEGSFLMRIQGRDVPYGLKRLDPSTVQLDQRNPRIQYLLRERHGGQATEEQIEEMLWEREAVKSLSAQIEQNGGVYNPIIVQRSNGVDKVREGNSRVVACRRKARSDPGNPAYMSVPAMVFEDALTDEDIAVIMAGEHVSGKTAWGAYEQAKHVFDLSNLYGKSYEWLAAELRLSKTRVTQLIAAYKATTKYLQQHPAPGNVSTYSFFDEIMRKSELKKRYEDDVDFQRQVNGWIAERRLTDSKQIRDLLAILASPEAVQALETDGHGAAREILARQDPALDSALFSAIKQATKTLQLAPMSELQGLKDSPAKIIALKNLKRAVEDLGIHAGVPL
jgi:hypothetical protein